MVCPSYFFKFSFINIRLSFNLTKISRLCIFNTKNYGTSYYIFFIQNFYGTNASILHRNGTSKRPLLGLQIIQYPICISPRTKFSSYHFLYLYY